jgi:hypothetical protein
MCHDIYVPQILQQTCKSGKACLLQNLWQIAVVPMTAGLHVTCDTRVISSQDGFAVGIEDEVNSNKSVNVVVNSMFFCYCYY